jgi:hypothetical protein
MTIPLPGETSELKIIHLVHARSGVIPGKSIVINSVWRETWLHLPQGLPPLNGMWGRREHGECGSSMRDSAVSVDL